MEQTLPPQTGHGSGFEKPTLRQFNIFLENRVGRLSQLLRALEEGSQQVNAINIEESADAALIRLICTNADAGRHALVEAGFSFSESEVLGVSLPTEMHFPLVDVCMALLAAEINVHYAYPMLVCSKSPAIVMYVDDRTLAAQILLRKGFALVGESDLKIP
jgi:hypothetical protein